MKYIVDTSIWSLALRRNTKQKSPAVEKLQKLLEGGFPIFMLGTIYQEILQGIRHEDQFRRIRDNLRILPMIDVSKDDHEEAARLFNGCRSHGIQASTIDCLIAAAAIRNDCTLLTTDNDFGQIARHASLKLLTIFQPIF